MLNVLRRIRVCTRLRVRRLRVILRVVRVAILLRRLSVRDCRNRGLLGSSVRWVGGDWCLYEGFGGTSVGLMACWV